MFTKNQALFVSSMFMMVLGAPLWSDMSPSAPVKVTIEKVGTEMKHELPQEDQNAFITSQVRVALRTNPGFAEDKVMIKTDKGVVTLSGTVANENVKTSLEKTAKDVPGVNSVKNELKFEKK